MGNNQNKKCKYKWVIYDIAHWLRHSFMSFCVDFNKHKIFVFPIFMRVWVHSTHRHTLIAYTQHTFISYQFIHSFINCSGLKCEMEHEMAIVSFHRQFHEQRCIPYQPSIHWNSSHRSFYTIGCIEMREWVRGLNYMIPNRNRFCFYFSIREKNWTEWTL